MIGSRWRVRDNGTWAHLEADFQPMCRHCGSEMATTNLKLLRFPLNEPAYWLRREINGHAVDVNVRCVECGYKRIFGVALAKEDWEKLYGKAEAEFKMGKNRGHSRASATVLN